VKTQLVVVYIKRDMSSSRVGRSAGQDPDAMMKTHGCSFGLGQSTGVLPSCI